MKKIGNGSPYFNWGLTAFLVLTGCILFYLLLGHLREIGGVIGYFFNILNSFVWGFAIAYVLLPLVKWLENKLLRPLAKKLSKHSRTTRGAPRVVAIALSITIALAAIMAILRLAIPTVYSSVETIVTNYNSYIETLVKLIERAFEDYPDLQAQLEATATDLSTDLLNWLTNKVLPQMGSFITNVTTGVYLVFRFILNIAIGFVVACYLLYNRELFSASAKKLLYSVFGIERAEKILTVIHFTDEAFMGFISGKVLDSLIIGVLTFACCTLLKMPFAAFVSIIVGVTNIIPVFGPFIGAVPCTIVILMADPMKALIFVVLILIIQQVDGNIIGPKILGSRVGINGFWVMFAIVLCGSLFGVPGMIVGVPLFVVLSAGYESLVDHGLEKRGLSTQTAQYVNMDHMDPETGIPVPREGERNRNRKGKRGKLCFKKPGNSSKDSEK